MVTAPVVPGTIVTATRLSQTEPLSTIAAFATYWAVGSTSAGS